MGSTWGEYGFFDVLGDVLDGVSWKADMGGKLADLLDSKFGHSFLCYAKN